MTRYAARLMAFTLVGLVPLTGSAFAEPKLERVRGVIEKAEDGSVAIKTTDGGTQNVALAADTKFVNVVKSSLDQIKDGVFIGTATKENTEPLEAIEVVLFPESMRGTGEGHYAWDAIQDHSGKGTVKSAMTNGTVKASASGTKVKSSMTNATVAKSEGTGGTRTLTVSYGGDQTKTITVPPKAPIVAFDPADKSILKPGGKIFVVAAQDGGKLTGKLVAVGKDGVTPPM